MAGTHASSAMGKTSVRDDHACGEPLSRTVKVTCGALPPSVQLGFQRNVADAGSNVDAGTVLDPAMGSKLNASPSGSAPEAMNVRNLPSVAAHTMRLVVAS